MPQLILPIFHKISTSLGNNIYYRNNNGTIIYSQGILPFFQHAEEDIQSFRFAISLLSETCCIKQIELSKAFGVSYIFVKRCVAIFRKHGIKGFYQEVKGRSPHILTEKVVNQAQKLLDDGNNAKKVGDF